MIFDLDACQNSLVDPDEPPPIQIEYGGVELTGLECDCSGETGG